MRVLFAGPTLSDDIKRIRQDDPELEILGPVTCGDICRTVEFGATAIGIVDGCFEQTRSVWHKEILFALSRNVAVAGAASMGALRAAECDTFGMVGIGDIYQAYKESLLTDDSDVALVHGPKELGYRGLTIPRVNIKATLNELFRIGVLSRFEWQSTIKIADRTHYSRLDFQIVFGGLKATELRRVDSLTKLATRYFVDVKREDAALLIDWLKQDTTRVQRQYNWEFSATSQWETVKGSLLANENRRTIDGSDYLQIH